MDGWIDWLEVWMDGKNDGWPDEWMEGCRDGMIHEEVDGWMDTSKIALKSV